MQGNFFVLKIKLKDVNESLLTRTLVDLRLGEEEKTAKFESEVVLDTIELFLYWECQVVS